LIDIDLIGTNILGLNEYRWSTKLQWMYYFFEIGEEYDVDFEKRVKLENICSH
jgi:hypothetical protein